MYLIDTNVISEARKRAKANRGVRTFFRRVTTERTPVFISVITVGELRRGVELIRCQRPMERLSGAAQKYQSVSIGRVGSGAHSNSEPS